MSTKQPAQIFAIHCYEILFRMDIDFHVKLVLLKGKLRRLFYTTFHKDYVEHSLQLRHSSCGRTGVCCRLGYPCPNLGVNPSGTPYCKIHEHRPQNCRIFPLDWQDVQDRNLIAPHEPCGYEIPPKEVNNFQKFQQLKKEQKKRLHTQKKNLKGKANL
jgi:Fe-S-cluster containining protein